MENRTIADLLEELIYEVSEDDAEFKNPKYIKELKEEINKRLSLTPPKVEEEMK